MKDFNSHAHVERDLSICNNLAAFLYFNSHAHVERDHLLVQAQCERSDFNSHAHVERDIAEGEFKGFFDISTHTLTWSVTITSRS